MAIDPVLGAAGAAVFGLFAWLARWAWTHTHQRIDETRLDAHKRIDDMHDVIREHDAEDRRRHEEVIRITVRLETQMGRFLSDMESEKRTRAEVNRELFAELKLIRDRLPERRDGEDAGRKR